eukprot:TRINITY_DN11468_c0_g1_i1.p1 TRINITY_DN11468_c0_g1~~TRINITY_DN11468_c0_g1_i1.p1  ORF type:complete len:119 (+),score=17.92 TRINITY_DN11468_c0_g1_i1:63-419(+)
MNSTDCKVQQFISYTTEPAIWFLRVDIQKPIHFVIWAGTFCPTQCNPTTGTCYDDTISPNRGTCNCEEPTDSMTFYCQSIPEVPGIVPEIIALVSLTSTVVAFGLIGFLIFLVVKLRK